MKKYLETVRNHCPLAKVFNTLSLSIFIEKSLISILFISYYPSFIKTAVLFTVPLMINKIYRLPCQTPVEFRQSILCSYVLTDCMYCR